MCKECREMCRLITYKDTTENSELFDWINEKENSNEFIIETLLKEFNKSKNRKVGINGEMSKYRR